jgi:hypothetical protein
MAPQTDPPPPADDRIANDICSDSPYRRQRATRLSQFGQPLPRTLAWQSGLLAGLALVLPLAVFFDPGTSPSLPNVAPAAASPKVLLLGVLGGTVEAGSALALVALGAYRARASPLSEATAARVVDLEDVASAVGLVTGGLAIALTLAYFLLGALGGDLLASAVAVGGANPFADSGLALTVTHVAVAAVLASAALLVARQALVAHLPDRDAA